MSEEIERTNPKPLPVDRLSLLWLRVNDHRIVQWAVAYVALAYGIQHGVTLTSEAFDWPHVVARISMLLLALGLPLVMTFAWYHGMRANRRISGPELTIISILLVIGSLLFFMFVQPSEEVAGRGAPAVQQASAAAVSPRAQPGVISVAVLPFVNLSSDKEQEFFSDGMTEEITSALAKIPNLRVVGRTSAFEFKGENKDLRKIGQALSASHLIEGSVRKDGNEVRITAQLIKADDGTHLWTESYNRELKGVFAIQEEIAQAIATSLRVPLGLKEGETLVSSRTGDTESYQDYLRAKALVRARGLGALTEAEKLLEQVVARDPNYAPAWALLAQAYYLVPNYDRAFSSGSVTALRRIVDASLPKAEAAARKAVALDTNNADAYVSLGQVLSIRGSKAQAEDSYKRALALDPNNPDALHWYSLMLGGAGRSKEALAMRQKLRALEPFVPVFNWNNAAILMETEQYDASIAMLKILPAGNAVVGLQLAMAYAALDQFKEAADALTKLSPAEFPEGMVGNAVRLLRSAPAKAVSAKELPDLGGFGFVYLYVGAPDRVLEFYEGNIEAGYSTPGAPYIWVQALAPVRKTERFKAFVRKAGFVEYWRARGWPDLCRPVGADDFVCD